MTGDDPSGKDKNTTEFVRAFLANLSKRVGFSMEMNRLRDERAKIAVAVKAQGGSLDVVTPPDSRETLHQDETVPTLDRQTWSMRTQPIAPYVAPISLGDARELVHHQPIHKERGKEMSQKKEMPYILMLLIGLAGIAFLLLCSTLVNDYLTDKSFQSAGKQNISLRESLVLKAAEDELKRGNSAPALALGGITVPQKQTSLDDTKPRTIPSRPCSQDAEAEGKSAPTVLDPKGFYFMYPGCAWVIWPKSGTLIQRFHDADMKLFSPENNFSCGPDVVQCFNMMNQVFSQGNTPVRVYVGSGKNYQGSIAIYQNKE